MSLPFGGMFSSRRTESDQADIAREEKHGGRTRAQVGVIGIVVIALVVITAMQMDKLPYLAPISTYSAYFDDAGGLAKGDIVSVSGVQVGGTVEGIELAGTDQGTKVKVSFRMDDTIEMGDETQAAIRTETVLGRRNLTVIPHGGERIKPGGSITLGNTIAPYSLQDALEGATDTISGTDTDQLNTALNTLTVTFSETPRIRCRARSTASPDCRRPSPTATTNSGPCSPRPTRSARSSGTATTRSTDCSSTPTHSSARSRCAGMRSTS